jgi:hypothetical protein
LFFCLLARNEGTVNAAVCEASLPKKSELAADAAFVRVLEPDSTLRFFWGVGLVVLLKLHVI